MDPLISVLVTVLIIAVIVWGVFQLSPLLPSPIDRVLQVVVIVICCIWLIRLLIPLAGVSF